MAFEEKAVTITVPAGADLSAKQYEAVKLNSSGQAISVATAGEAFVGWLQNKPDAAGKAAVIAIAGRAKVKAGAAVTIGDVIIANASAKAIKATATALTEGTPNTFTTAHAGAGIAMTAAGGANEIIDALITLPVGMVTTDVTAQ